jgi:lipopolysaccharide export system permease protein
MKILDKYLLKHFIPAYFLAGVIFCSFYFLVDLLSNLNEFIDKGAQLVDIAGFYAFFFPSLWIKLSPLAVLIGVWFSVGHLAQDREIMAMRLSGISSVRIILSLIISGLLISFFCLIINVKLVPFCEEKKQETWKGRIQGEEEYLTKTKENFIFSYRDDVYFVKSFDGKKRVMKGVRIVYKSSNNGPEIKSPSRIHPQQKKTDITAQEAIWDNREWVLIDGIKRTFDKDDNIEEVEEFDKKEISLLLSPHELWLYNKSPSFISTTNLKDKIKEYKNTSTLLYPYWTELHSRFSLPFINFTLLIVSIPFCLLSLHQSSVGRMGWALGLSLVYYVFFSLMVAISEKGNIYPPLGVWLPNLLFLTIGTIYIWRKR